MLKVIKIWRYLLFIDFLDGAGTNKQHVTTKNTAKLDRETEELRHEKVPLEVGKIIMQGRQAKGLSQKDLATVSIQNEKKKHQKILWQIRQPLLLCLLEES